MDLHVPTLALVVGLTSLLQAVGFWIVGRFNPGLVWVRWWGVAALMNGLGCPLLTLRLVVDLPWLTKVLPTLLNGAGSALFYVGAAVFAGRPVRRWPGLVALLLFLGYLWFLLVDFNLRVRPFFAGAVFSLFQVLGVLALLHERRPGLRFFATFTAATSLLSCVVLAYRAVSMALSHQPAEVLDSHWLQVSLFLTALLWVLTWTFGTMSLVNQRILLETRLANEARILAKDEALALEKELASERALRQRRLLVRDLHDGLGGITANLAMLANRRSADSVDASLPTRLQNLQNLATEANREVTLIMNSVEQRSAHWADVLTDVRRHAERLAESHGFGLHWTVSGRVPTDPVVDVPALLSLARATKEGLNNLARHSGARTATVRFSFRARQVGVLVRDDGTRCGDGASWRPGRGLGNMRRRVEELGGRFVLRTGHGTALRFLVPLPIEVRPLPAEQDPVDL